MSVNIQHINIKFFISSKSYHLWEEIKNMMPPTMASAWSEVCWLVVLPTLQLFPWTLPSAKSKLILVSQLECLTVSARWDPLDKPLWVGLQLSLDILFKVSESSDSMKSSRMSSKTLLDNKTLRSTEKSDGQLHQALQKSLLIFYSAHGKPSS